MSDKSYTYSINPNTVDSHQSTPWASLAVYSYTYPDTFHNQDIGQDKALQVFRTLIVSDILSVTVSTTKGGPQHVAEVLLSSGDFDYKARFSTKDHALIWIHNDSSKFTSINNSILNGNPSNGFNSGLKFVGKIQSVREVYNTSPNGIKTLRYMLVLQGFSEFESQVYFNPQLKITGDTLQNISSKWYDYLGAAGGLTPTQSVIEFFLSVFFGFGPNHEAVNPTDGKTVVASPNNAFLFPKLVAKTLNVTKPAKQSIAYVDILHSKMGIQKYSKKDKFIPFLLKKVEGNMLHVSDNFNNVTMWNLLDTYKNPAMNETYVTLRVAKDDHIYPHFILRQHPFTSKFYEGSLPKTDFLELPRWKISSKLQIGPVNIGTNDSGRCNFLQIYGQMYDGSNPFEAMQSQISGGKNSAIDNLDIIRSGSRNISMTSNSDVVSKNKEYSSSIHEWRDVIADWTMNMHLKDNGTFTFAGIVEPICIGDNLEFDGGLYHIESITHNYSVDEVTGMKSFTTSISCSHGILTNGEYSYTKDDHRRNLRSQMAPGYSDTELYVNEIIITSSNEPKKKKGKKR